MFHILNIQFNGNPPRLTGCPAIIHFVQLYTLNSHFFTWKVVTDDALKIIQILTTDCNTKT